MIQYPIRWQLIIGVGLLTLLALSVSACRLDPRSPEGAPESATGLVEASGIKGGLVVVIGCDDPTLLANLRGAGPYLVQCLDGDPGEVAAARKHLREKKLYGSITVSRLQGTQLPYVDDLVNLIVVAGDTEVPAGEMIRALAPKGVIADIRKSKVEITRKDRPAELDEWTHYLYDASNHAVSNDTVVGPPRGLRWTCGPEYARSHEHFSSVSAMVTTGGRVFYIIDEGPISSVWLPPEWKLMARDAFNGVMLWQRPIKNWESQLRGFRSGPPEIGRRMVAKDEKVYVSLGYGEPVTVLDAPTGEPLATLAGTSGARELLLTGGVLYVLADDMTAAQHDERKEWINRTAPTVQAYSFPREAIPMYGTQRIIAIKTGTGELLWNRGFEAPGEIMPATMAAVDERICLQTVSHVVCLDASEGKESWRREHPVARSRFSWSTPTLVIHDGVVLTVDRVAKDNADKSPPAQGSKWLMDNAHQTKKQDAEMVAFSLEDGRELWHAPYFENYDTQMDIFVIDGVVWVGDLRHSRDPGFTQGRDLKTGKVTATLPHNRELYDLQMGHHRCYRNKATVRWMLLGRDGIEFVDPKNGTGEGHWWVRGACQYGIMPANGLIYAPQHSCACHPEEKLIGFNAVSSQSSAGKGPGSIEKGPAYGGISNLAPSSSATEWPTYRRDVRRSGYQDLPAPGKPAVVWTKKLAPPITAPVAADGMVFVAETDRHTLHALSTKTGEPAWTFIADGRIDSPPTLFNGLCLFGARNGFVYCLRASDGALVWRFRAATRDRRLFAYEQLESVWPVHGSVLVDDKLSDGVATVYFAAGRSSHIDGGIRLYALELNTGKVLQKADVNMTAEADGAGIIRQRAMPDILSAQKGAVWMRDLGVDKNLAPVEKLPHLYAPGGFLDDTWWHRTYWVYGTTMLSTYVGWPLIGNVAPAGRLLAFDGGELIYGYGRMVYRHGAGHVRPDAAKEYRLFAETPPAKALDVKNDTRWWERKRQIRWSAQLPFVARSIVLTRDALLVAGGESLTESAESHGPGTFWVASRGDGSKKAGCALPAPPVLDGVALTDAGVFVSAVDGSLLRLGDAK